MPGFAEYQPVTTDFVDSTEIIAEFDRDIRSLYSVKDFRLGYIETRDRPGTLNRFPFMTLSISIVANDQLPLTSYAQVGEAAAELKRYAKPSPVPSS